jgi:anti-sigma-K factor RskA
MNDEDLDALAAEYVLGTLAGEERTHAEAMIAIDPGFAEVVRQWERRLGELNVMVEAVEPPAEVWDKIKSDIGAPAPPAHLESAPQIAEELSPAAEEPAEGEGQVEGQAEGEEPLLGAVAPTLLPEGGEDGQEDSGAQSDAQSPAEFLLQPPIPTPAVAAERNAEVINLGRRVRRWRGLAVSCGAIAAVLAALIVVSQVRPDLIPAGGFHIPQLMARTTPAAAPSAPAPGSRLVAVLQQAPAAPAFLLTIDPAARTMTVRTVAAKAATGHSFELWLIAPHAAKPVSLGLVGGTQYTQRPLPADFDADTLRAATYAISFEPAGGSKTGAPTGPILFTGKLVESVPPSAQKT